VLIVSAHFRSLLLTARRDTTDSTDSFLAKQPKIDANCAVKENWRYQKDGKSVQEILRGSTNTERAA